MKKNQALKAQQQNILVNEARQRLKRASQDFQTAQDNYKRAYGDYDQALDRLAETVAKIQLGVREKR